MEKKQFDNENFVLYSPDSLNYITHDLETILYNSLELYEELFDVENFRKVQINYFDDLEKFRNFIYELRGEKESLPEYARGTFDKGMINAYIKPGLIENSALYNRKRLTSSHELFHIMYKELVWGKRNLPRIVWFDEGLAQFFSGQNDEQLKDDAFIKNIILKTKTIPNLNDLSHGSKFKTDEYNGYLLSLIAVKEIFDELGIDEFKKLLYDSERIYEYGDNILNKIFDKYKQKGKK